MILDLLNKNRVVICVGSGGVGKTTVSAALAVVAAREGKNVLVMTIDPSRRLKVALGIDSDHSEPVKVPGQNYKGQISAVLLKADEIFKNFVMSSASNNELAARLLQNRLYKQLSTTLSGSQEFTSLLQLTSIVHRKEYDLIILDTPPSQHALDFLEAPEKIEALFEENVVRWFLGESENKSFVRKVLSKGTRTVLSALEFITGNVFMSELNDFFISVKSVQSKINKSTKEVQEILRADNTGFFLVSGFDEAKMNEAETFRAYLQKKQFRMLAVLINKAFPLWPSEEKVEAPALAAIYEQWRQYHLKRAELFKIFKQKWSKQLPVFSVPDLNKELTGLQSLEFVADEVLHDAR